MAEIALQGVGKVYADGTEAVRDLTLTISDGELMVLVGPSGCGKMNFVEAELRQVNGGIAAVFGSETLALDEAETQARPALAGMLGRRVILGVRPEHLTEATGAGPGPPGRSFQAAVSLVEALGSETIVHFEIQATPVLTEDVRELALDVDEAALGDLERDRSVRRTAFVARLGGLVHAPSTGTIDLTVAPGMLHFFDRDTGWSITS